MNRKIKGIKIVYLCLVVMILITISFISYQIYINNFRNEIIDFFYTNESNIRAMLPVEIVYDIDIITPNWSSFWNGMSMRIYSFIGYNASLILDLLQVSILFFSGAELLKILIFNPVNSEQALNPYFIKLFIMGFVLYGVLTLYHVQKLKRESSLATDGILRNKLLYGIVMAGCSFFFLILSALIMYIVVKIMYWILFPFMLGGTVINNGNSLLGQYTLSTIVFNSSFKEQMGSYVYVPQPEALFPGQTYIFSGQIRFSEFEIILWDKNFEFTVNAKNQAVVDSINFFLLYITDIVLIVLLTIISVKIARMTIMIFALAITSSLYLATHTEDNEMAWAWGKKVFEIFSIYIVTIFLYLLFTSSIPLILMAFIDTDMQNFRDVNWLGMINIIVIIAGLITTIKIDKLIVKKEKRKQQTIEVINHNETNNNEGAFIG